MNGVKVKAEEIIVANDLVRLSKQKPMTTTTATATATAMEVEVEEPEVEIAAKPKKPIKPIKLIEIEESKESKESKELKESKESAIATFHLKARNVRIDRVKKFGTAASLILRGLTEAYKRVNYDVIRLKPEPLKQKFTKNATKMVQDRNKFLGIVLHGNYDPKLKEKLLRKKCDYCDCRLFKLNYMISLYRCNVNKSTLPDYDEEGYYGMTIADLILHKFILLSAVITCRLMLNCNLRRFRTMNSMEIKTVERYRRVFRSILFRKFSPYNQNVLTKKMRRLEPELVELGGVFFAQFSVNLSL